MDFDPRARRFRLGLLWVAVCICVGVSCMPVASAASASAASGTGLAGGATGISSPMLLHMSSRTRGGGRGPQAAPNAGLGLGAATGKGTYPYRRMMGLGLLAAQQRYQYRQYRQIQQGRTLTRASDDGEGLSLTEMELHEMVIEGLNLKIARPAGIDDVILDLAAQGGDLDQYFWAFVWPAATALAREFRMRPALVEGKTICEIGAGLGIAGLTAAANNAKRVMLLDNKVQALACAVTTAQQNGISVDPDYNIPDFTLPEGGGLEDAGNEGTVSARLFDWDSPLNSPQERYDMIILGDVFQSNHIVQKLQAQVPMMLNPGGCIIIAGGSLDVAELNFVGAMTELGYGLEEVSKRDIQREYDVQMEDPNGSIVHLVRLREGAASADQGDIAQQIQENEDDDDMDDIDVDQLLKEEDIIM